MAAAWDWIKGEPVVSPLAASCVDPNLGRVDEASAALQSTCTNVMVDAKDCAVNFVPPQVYDCYDLERRFPVTEEMIAAGSNAYIAAVKCDNRKAAEVIYRAMAALTPKSRVDFEADNAGLWVSIAMHQRDRIAALEADNAALLVTIESLDRRLGQLAAFTGASPTPADIPDPARRPDGTLAPAAKPWTPPRGAGDGRRVGG